MKVQSLIGRGKKSSLLRKTAWLCTGALAVSLLNTQPMQGQFGISIAAILAGLEALNATMQSALAVPLAQVQAIEAQTQSFQQTVLYPTSGIAMLQAMAGSMYPEMMANNGTMNSPVLSATLPMTQSFEQAILSGDPSNIASLAPYYYSVYGSLPTTMAATSQTQSQIDMTDAQAQDSMKKSIEIDAVAEREMEESGNLMQQIQSATPGTAPMLEAQASAWIMQGNAYSQTAMAQLMRVRAASLSLQSANLKNGATANQNVNNVVTNLLTQ